MEPIIIMLDNNINHILGSYKVAWVCISFKCKEFSGNVRE
jgi:hypothetical protein